MASDNKARAPRLQKEIAALAREPPPGVAAWPADGVSMERLTAQLDGPPGTPYEGGVFILTVQIPERYPFEPPAVHFVTPVYHPNIDGGGRICLDILKSGAKGAWKPSLNVATVLQSIGLLLSEPNPDDGLMNDISAEFKHARAVFEEKARRWTQQHACGALGGGAEAAAAGALPQAAPAAEGGASGSGAAAAKRPAEEAAADGAAGAGPAAAEAAPAGGAEEADAAPAPPPRKRLQLARPAPPPE